MLIQVLQNFDLFDYLVDEFYVIEIYIFQVLLIGDYVYKIKKLMDFGFLNFLILDCCKYFCEEELWLNCCLVNQFYLDVVFIIGSFEQLVLGGVGELFEYVIKMCQFSQQELFDCLQEQDELLVEVLIDLVCQVVEFYE